jgi:serine/threonine-protein kinase
MALRRGSIGPETLMAALKEWQSDKRKPLEAILAEHQMVSVEEITRVKASMEAQLRAHQNDTVKTLAALAADASVAKLQASCADQSLRQALSQVGTLMVPPNGDQTGVTNVAPPEAKSSSAHPAGDPTFPSGTGSGTQLAPNVSAAPTMGVGGPSPTLPEMPPLPSSAGTHEMAQSAEPALHTISFVSNVDVTQEAPTKTPGPLAAGAGKVERAPEIGTNIGPSRYKALRAFARGGLGEVFVALDEELRREVALKEIQGRHADRQESQLRFLLEAEITGNLEHPGIVPVYGLGRHPDGRPWYAMKFIRGEDFREKIDLFHEKMWDDPGARDLEFRQLLNRFIDVCHAIAYAHDRGILHRDIKPDNIRLGAFGETLVVDWGLAKVLSAGEDEAITKLEQGKEPLSGVGRLRPLSASGKSETLYGSAMGTPQFMSPEQAAGKLDQLSPASDVYSLGATLYYLLTGQKAFRDINLAELLKKVQRSDFPPPREINRSVPAPLEAICLKAMARAPQDRYQTATELLVDLEHWLADEPVSVYNEPLLERAARWAKRHKRLVTGLAVFLITGITALGITSVLVKREQQRTEYNFRLARAAVDQMLTELGQVELAEVPQMEQVRKKMLGKALEFYQKFLKERAGDLSVRDETGRASIRLGDIFEMLGEYPRAEKAYKDAILLLEPLAAKHPKVAEFRRDLGWAHHELGVLEKKSLRFEEAEKDLKSAKDIRKTLAVQNPDNPNDVRDAKDSVYWLGTLYAKQAQGQRDAAAAYQEAIAAETKLSAGYPNDPDYQRKLARYRNNKGMLLMGSEPRDAEEEFQAAFEVQDKMAKQAPTVAGLQWERARTLSNLGAVLKEQNKFENALRKYEQARDALKQLADAFPAIPDYKSELAAVYSNLGVAQQNLGQMPEAEASFKESMQIYEQLEKFFPYRPDYPRRLSDVELSMSLLQGKKNLLPEAEKWCVKSKDTLEKLVGQYPKVPEYQSTLALTLEFNSRLLNKEHDLPKARKSAEDAIEHQWLAMRDSDHKKGYRILILQEFDILAQVIKAQRDHDGAVKAAGDLIAMFRDDSAAQERAARFMTLASELVEQDTEIPAPEKSKRAAEYADRAIEHLKQAAQLGFQNPKQLDTAPYRKLREREDFKAIQKRIEAKGKPPVV